MRDWMKNWKRPKSFLIQNSLFLQWWKAILMKDCFICIRDMVRDAELRLWFCIESYAVI